MLKKIHIFVFCLIHNFILLTSANSVLIIIRSQSNEYHNRMATETKASIDAEIEKFQLECDVILLHQEWKVEAAWTILPLLPDIANVYSDQYDWIMFIEDITKIDVKRLVKNVLIKYNPKQNVFLGRCLHDNEPTIIHHYAYFDGRIQQFYYPDFHAGWLLSSALVKVLGSTWKSHNNSPDFFIDVQHEIAKYIDKQLSLRMVCVKELCGKANENRCVTWISNAIPDCGNKITLNDILFSVKTTQMYHETRLSVVKKTWGKYPKNIIYYSNVTDETVPTIDCGVPNTLHGHCGKTEAIIKITHEKKDLKKFPWLVIVDDDSIVGLSALLKLLNCYNPQHSLVLGERYGYFASKFGYSYITGGGGIVLSRKAIDLWIQKDCTCPSNDSPDDMILGQCFSSIGLPVTHSPRFHQARPQDYSDGYLDNLQPVSFHKHHNIDPVEVYKKYFSKDDEHCLMLSYSTVPTEAPEVIPMPIPPTPTEIPIKDEL